VPHLIVEYSVNLEPLINIQALVDAIHHGALATGVAPIDALRTRAEPRNVYRIGDGHPDNSFIAVAARLGAGRTPEQKHRFLTAVLDATEALLGSHATNVMISVEYQEIDPEFRINKNNIRDAIINRQTPSPEAASTSP
jgi:5-carboxymethyl-2-hydroxymuconate isomerase